MIVIGIVVVFLIQVLDIRGDYEQIAGEFIFSIKK